MEIIPEINLVYVRKKLLYETQISEYVGYLKQLYIVTVTGRNVVTIDVD